MVKKKKLQHLLLQHLLLHLHLHLLLTLHLLLQPLLMPSQLTLLRQPQPLQPLQLLNLPRSNS